MTVYLAAKYLHVLGGIVILGTGTGIAFFMLMAHLSRDAAFIARTATVVVIADMIFTSSAVLLPQISPNAQVRRNAIKTGPAIVLMLVALAMLDNR